uniref:BZIP domain-containing protein n=1 Tax=Cucumis melo TaxID=3656 RepID=A0A9I9EEG0_CUCME
MRNGNRVWTCRCREKQRKEASRLQTVNIKLNVMNKLLMEEKDQLQKQVSQLVCENGCRQQQLLMHVDFFETADYSDEISELVRE